VISCFLFGLAIPLAVFASPLLRFTIWLYNGLAGWALPAPRQLRTQPAVAAVPAARDSHKELASDQVTRQPKKQTTSVTHIPTAEPATAADTVPGQLHVPPFKMAVATLFVVLLGTAIASGFGKLVVMAVLEIIRGKTFGAPADFSRVYNVVELLLLPVGFLLLARLLQEQLPADFLTSCLVTAMYLLIFLLFILVLIGLLTLVFAVIGWMGFYGKPHAATEALLAIPHFAGAEILLDILW
jgi:hypothetical protein